MTFILFVLLFTIGFIHGAHFKTPDFEKWAEFKLKYNKTYETEHEEQLRFGIFINNVQKITSFNKHHTKGNISYKQGINQFSDKFEDELKTMMNYRKTSLRLRFEDTATPNDLPHRFIPPEKNWTAEGAVTKVKNQGNCNSCWAFSAAGTIEAQIYLRTKRLVSLSAQNLIDCSTEHGNFGCKGGFASFALAYIVRNGGIDTETSYPYKAQDLKCKYKATSRGASITGYKTIQQGNETQLKEGVALIGPISAAVHFETNLIRYRSGIYSSRTCKKSYDDLNHEVLVVGYGTENGQDYWLAKNSWGTDWGEYGYLRIARGSNMCGIATDASYAIL